MLDTIIQFVLADQFTWLWCLLTLGYFLLKLLHLFSHFTLLGHQFRLAVRRFKQAFDSQDVEARLQDLKKQRLLGSFWSSLMSKLVKGEAASEERRPNLNANGEPTESNDGGRAAGDSVNKPSFYTLQPINAMLQEHAPTAAIQARFASVGPTLTGLGILGTFIGLSAGIYVSRYGLASQDLEAMQEAISNMLSGAGLDFFASVIGLACSIAFGKIEAMLVRRSSGWQRRLSSVIQSRIDYLCPDVVLTSSQATGLNQLDALGRIERQIAEAVRGKVEINERALRECIEVFASAVNGLFKADIQHYMATVAQAAGKLEQSVSGIKEAGQVLAGVMTGLHSEMREATQALGLAIQSSVADLASASQGQLSRMNSAVTEAVNASISRNQGFLESSLTRLTASEEQSRDAARGAHAGLLEVVRQLQAGAAAFSENLGAMHGKLDITPLIQELRLSNLELTAISHGMKTMGRGTQGDDEDFKRELLMSIKQQSARVRDVIENMEQAFLRIEGGLNNQTSKMLAGVNIAIDKMTQFNMTGHAQLSRNLDELNVSVQKLYDITGSSLLRSQIKL